MKEYFYIERRGRKYMKQDPNQTVVELSFGSITAINPVDRNELINHITDRNTLIHGTHDTYTHTHTFLTNICSIIFIWPIQ